MDRRTVLRGGALVVACVVAVRLPGSLGSSALLTATLGLVYAVAGLSVVVLTGWTGQVSLAQVGFMGTGAYVMARLLDPQVGLPLVVAVPAAMAATAFLSLVVGLLAIRVRGIHFTVLTLAVGQALEGAVFSNQRLTGSANGLPVTRPSIGPIDLASDGTLFGVLLGVLVAACGVVALLRRSMLGRQMMSLSASPRAVAARGIDITSATLAAVGLSAALAALAGCALALAIGTVGPASFTPLQSALLVALVVLCGARSMAGAIVAGVLYATLPQLLPRLLGDPVQASRAVNLVAGLGLLVAVIAREQLAAPARRLRLVVIARIGGPPPSRRTTELRDVAA